MGEWPIQDSVLLHSDWLKFISQAKKNSILSDGVLFCCTMDSNPSKCNSPVDCCGHQFKNWWQLYVPQGGTAIKSFHLRCRSLMSIKNIALFALTGFANLIQMLIFAQERMISSYRQMPGYMVFYMGDIERKG